MLDEKTHLRVFVIDQSARALQLESLENQQILIDRSGVVEVASVKKESTCIMLYF